MFPQKGTNRPTFTLLPAESFWLSFNICIGEFPLRSCTTTSCATRSVNYHMWPLEGSTKRAVSQLWLQTDVEIVRFFVWDSFALNASFNSKW